MNQSITHRSYVTLDCCIALERINFHATPVLGAVCNDRMLSSNKHASLLGAGSSLLGERTCLQTSDDDFIANGNSEMMGSTHPIAQNATWTTRWGAGSFIVNESPAHGSPPVACQAHLSEVGR
jgi:hypothetical protein